MRSHQHDREEAERPVSEAGGGESEGFELAEQELIEHATHSDEHAAGHVLTDALPAEEAEGATAREGDSEHTSESRDDSDTETKGK